MQLLIYKKMYDIFVKQFICLCQYSISLDNGINMCRHSLKPKRGEGSKLMFQGRLLSRTN